jgi:hypothetical protein
MSALQGFYQELDQMPSRKKAASSKQPRKSVNGTEHKLATPRGDLFVLRVGKSKALADSRQPENSNTLIDRMVKAALKPGIRRDTIFRPGEEKRVYAYSIFPGDVTKIVREDASGKKTLGTLVQGKFRPLRSQSM